MSAASDLPTSFACNNTDEFNGDARNGGGDPIFRLYEPRRKPSKVVAIENGKEDSKTSDNINNSDFHNDDTTTSSSTSSPKHHGRSNRRSSDPQPSHHVDLLNVDDSWASRSSKIDDSSQRSFLSDINKPLYARLVNQRWHEIGSGEYPLCATDDFDLMVEQLSSVLAARLADLLIHRLGIAQKTKRQGEGYEDGISIFDYLKLDVGLGDYVLADSVMDSLQDYVVSIGRLHNKVGFHSFEHATHVCLAMNKLLSMVTTADDLNVTAKRRLSAQDIASSAFKHPNSRRSSVSTESSGDSDGHRRHAEHVSFGISEDPAIRFAMVFSALIHDVGEWEEITSVT